MNTSKLREALIELQAERNAIDNAIVTLQRLISASNGSSAPIHNTEASKNIVQGTPSYVDATVHALELHGKPMSIKDLTFEVEKAIRKKVSRASFESTVGRHIKKNKNPRVIRVGPGYFGLPGWPSINAPLWSDVKHQPSSES